MKKSQGIVMRTSKKTTVILTEKGDFLEVPTPKALPKVGDTIQVDLKPKQTPLHYRSWSKYTASAAALLLVISLTVFYVFALPNMAVASVALDMDQSNVDKSIELLVNKDGKVIEVVIEVRDMNGRTYTLDKRTLTGKDAYQAVDLIIESAAKQGNLKESDNLVFARIIPLSKWMDSNLDRETLKNSIQNEMLRLNLHGNLVVGESDEKVRQEALDHGMSVNNHLIYERCQEKGIDLPPEAIQGGNLQKALSDAQTNVMSLFPEESIEIKSPQKSGGNGTHEQDRSEPWKPESNSPEENHMNPSMMGPSKQNTSPMNVNGQSSNTNNSVNPPSMNMNASMPPNPSQQENPMTNSHSTNDNQSRDWNSETGHDREYQSSKPMNSWQDSDSTHDSNQDSYRSW